MKKWAIRGTLAGALAALIVGGIELAKSLTRKSDTDLTVNDVTELEDTDEEAQDSDGESTDEDDSTCVD